MITISIIGISFGLIALLIAGTLRATFELTMIFGIHNGYSKKEFENKSKDSDKDEKISWWELTFPDEPLHKAKRWEMFLNGTGATLTFLGLLIFVYALQWLNIISLVLIVVINPILFFGTTGFGFDLYFKQNRPK